MYVSYGSYIIVCTTNRQKPMQYKIDIECLPIAAVHVYNDIIVKCITNINSFISICWTKIAILFYPSCKQYNGYL